MTIELENWLALCCDEKIIVLKGPACLQWNGGKTPCSHTHTHTHKHTHTLSTHYTAHSGSGAREEEGWADKKERRVERERKGFHNLVFSARTKRLNVLNVIYSELTALQKRLLYFFIMIFRAKISSLEAFIRASFCHLHEISTQNLFALAFIKVLRRPRESFIFDGSFR